MGFEIQIFCSYDIVLNLAAKGELFQLHVCMPVYYNESVEYCKMLGVCLIFLAHVFKLDPPTGASTGQLLTAWWLLVTDGKGAAMFLRLSPHLTNVYIQTHYRGICPTRKASSWNTSRTCSDHTPSLKQTPAEPAVTTHLPSNRHQQNLQWPRTSPRTDTSRTCSDHAPSLEQTPAEPAVTMHLPSNRHQQNLQWPRTSPRTDTSRTCSDHAPPLKQTPAVTTHLPSNRQPWTASLLHKGNGEPKRKGG